MASLPIEEFHLPFGGTTDQITVGGSLLQFDTGGKELESSYGTTVQAPDRELLPISTLAVLALFTSSSGLV